MTNSDVSFGCADDFSDAYNWKDHLDQYNKSVVKVSVTAAHRHLG
jgi:hypothetical protein